MMKIAAVSLCLLVLCVSARASDPELVISGDGKTAEAPHHRGNVYAPDIVRDGQRYLMYYGGQGVDGHDRIHLATSPDGATWERLGVVFGPEGINHVNDPSVVIVDGKFYLYYTRANVGVTDTIGLAVSKDGQHWEDQGTVLAPRPRPAWNSLLVGRPSVLYDGTRFRMWFDGRANLPIGAPDVTAPKSPMSQRYVGYAESTDGRTWKQRDQFVLAHDAGGVHVAHIDGRYVMLIESRDGTIWASSNDGVAWQKRGLLLPKDPRTAPYGHVTPFLFATGESNTVYFGAARATNWNQNAIMRAPLPALPR